MADDGFRRRRWRGGTGTEIPLPPDDTALVDTRAWNPQVGYPLLWLVVAEPAASRGAILPVEPGNIIGRRGDVRWHDERMSREHARIRLVRHPDDPDQLVYVIEPMNDRNGTFVNGNGITAATPILENDRIEMGDTLFVVKVLE